jgi:hypothetical protein
VILGLIGPAQPGQQGTEVVGGDEAAQVQRHRADVGEGAVDGEETGVRAQAPDSARPGSRRGGGGRRARRPARGLHGHALGLSSVDAAPFGMGVPPSTTAMGRLRNRPHVVSPRAIHEAPARVLEPVG